MTIVASVAGFVVALAIALVLALLCYFKRRKRRRLVLPDFGSPCVVCATWFFLIACFFVGQLSRVTALLRPTELYKYLILELRFSRRGGGVRSNMQEYTTNLPLHKRIRGSTNSSRRVAHPSKYPAEDAKTGVQRSRVHKQASLNTKKMWGRGHPHHRKKNAALHPPRFFFYYKLHFRCLFLFALCTAFSECGGWIFVPHSTCTVAHLPPPLHSNILHTHDSFHNRVYLRRGGGARLTMLW